MFESVKTITLDKIKRIPQVFLLKDFLPMPAHTVGMVASSGGMGKTFASIQIASKFVDETKRDALIWLSEDEEAVVGFRFDAIADEFGLKKETQSKIHYVKTAPVQFAKKDQGLFRADYEALAGIRTDCIKNNIGLVVIDPLLAFYGGDENDNSQARVFMQAFLEWAKTDHINILFVHHSKKSDGGTRGAGAFVDSCRFVYEFHYPKNGEEIDFEKKDKGIREVRLVKDNHNAFYWFSALNNGEGQGDMKVLPAQKKQIPVNYQDLEGRYVSKPVEIHEYKMDMPMITEQPDEVHISLADHNDEKNPKGFEKKAVHWNELVDVMSMGRAYSPSFFTGGHRKSTNYTGGNDLVFLDIDEGMTLDQAKKAFSGLKSIIVTTKSHRKEKRGIVADRFRVVLKLSESINLPADEYRIAMQSIFDFFGSVADRSTKDPARFFYSSPVECEVWYSAGDKLFNWKEVYDKAKKIEAIEAHRRMSAPAQDYGDTTIQDAADALGRLDPDCEYNIWTECGMALQAGFGEAGFQVWDDWSRRGSKYSEREMSAKWKSFTSGAIGIATLFHHAKSAA